MNNVPTDFIKNPEARLADLAPSIRSVCLQSVSQPYSFIPAAIVEKLCRQENSTKHQLGLALLPLATTFAVTPISHFRVGAVVFDCEGNTYLGANFEFAHTHIGQTIHAEQSAILHAWAHNATELQLLVVNYAPCGHCRQFINEVNTTKDFQIQLPNSQPQALQYYLPDSFGPSDLGVTEKILSRTRKQPTVNTSMTLREYATVACHASHAPYSHNYSGIALQYESGNIFTGRYAENAAFNPSVPPLQMALNSSRLHGEQWQSVTQACLVECLGESSGEQAERRATSLSQRDNTEALLHTLCQAPLSYATCD